MNAARANVVRCVVLASVIAGVAGCLFNTHGNRSSGAPLIARTAELRGVSGKRVTLVGTARAESVRGARIDLRGGSVELPAYSWPQAYVDKRVMVTGHLMSEPRRNGRVYQLGEIESVAPWGR